MMLSSKSRPWTKDEVEYVRVHYKNNRASLASIAKHLNRTTYSIHNKVSALSITNGRQKYKPWVKADEEFLKDKYGEYSMNKLCETLSRTATSITCKAYALGIKRCFRNDWYTLGDISKICGVALETVGQWIKDRKLIADSEYNKNDDRVRVHRISIDAFRKFLRRFPIELQGHNVDIVQLVEILAGVIYDNPCADSSLPMCDN
jgi:hypothetical protein